MANSVDPNQTAPKRSSLSVCPGSTLFASILNSSVMLVTSADVIFQMLFFLGL